MKLVKAFKEGEVIPEGSVFLGSETRVVGSRKEMDEHPWHDTVWYDVPVYGKVYLYEINVDNK